MATPAGSIGDVSWAAVSEAGREEYLRGGGGGVRGGRRAKKKDSHLSGHVQVVRDADLTAGGAIEERAEETESHRTRQDELQVVLVAAEVVGEQLGGRHGDEGHVDGQRVGGGGGSGRVEEERVVRESGEGDGAGQHLGGGRGGRKETEESVPRELDDIPTVARDVLDHLVEIRVQDLTHLLRTIGPLRQVNSQGR
jgi:hypothetical protein